MLAGASELESGWHYASMQSAFRRFRILAATPAKPVPSRTIVAGSGVGVGDVLGADKLSSRTSARAACTVMYLKLGGTVTLKEFG